VKSSVTLSEEKEERECSNDSREPTETATDDTADRKETTIDNNSD
jgi:hypothetical protein